MRGPATLDDVIDSVVRATKTAAVWEPPAPVSSRAAEFRKLAAITRVLSEPAIEPDYADLHRVKASVYGR